jgi:hypothetical protein
MVLDGLEAVTREATKGLTKIHVIRYADDFIVTAETPEILEERVKPAVEAFLQARGLSLAQEKTHITHIDTGATLHLWVFLAAGISLPLAKTDRVRQKLTSCLKQHRRQSNDM